MYGQRIELKDAGMDVVLKMGEGNPGAISVLCELLKHEHGFMLVLDLDDMGMRGPMIWEAYKFCKQDAAKLVEALRDRDPKMVEHVNKWSGDKRRAVTHGASR